MYQRSRYLMGTVCDIAVEDSGNAAGAVSEAFKEIERIERVLSTWRDDTELARLNAGPLGVPHTVSTELADLLREVLKWSEQTGGAFNPFLGHLLEAWDLRGKGRIPSDEELQRAIALSRTDAVSLHRSSPTITRQADIDIEEGGFGKGYALDRSAQLLRRHRVPRALINFGGQVLVFGYEGSPAEVRLAHPERRDQAVATLRVETGSVSTSSGSERAFSDGTRSYSHILDPRTGFALPPRGSVTVIHPSAIGADIGSTALYVLGPDEGLKWAEQNAIAAVFMTPSRRGYDVTVSSWVTRNGIGLTITDSGFESKG